MFILYIYIYIYIYMYTYSEDSLFVILHSTQCNNQVFTNCMHGFDIARNVHASDVVRTQQFVHGIDSSVQK